MHTCVSSHVHVCHHKGCHTCVSSQALTHLYAYMYVVTCTCVSSQGLSYMCGVTSSDPHVRIQPGCGCGSGYLFRGRQRRQHVLHWGSAAGYVCINACVYVDMYTRLVCLCWRVCVCVGACAYMYLHEFKKHLCFYTRTHMITSSLNT